MTTNQVIVRPLPPKGRNLFAIFPGTFKKYGAGMSPVTGKRITGLTPEKEAELTEKLGIDISAKSSFWTEFTIVIDSKGSVLDLSDPIQELQYWLLTTKSDIATSKDKIKPHSVFVMYNEEYEANKDNVKFDYDLSAYSYIKEMSEEDRANFLKLFGYRTRNMSPSVIKKTLKDKADSDSKYFVELYEDKNKIIKILIQDCVHYGVIAIKNGAYYFGEDMLGADLNLAINKIKTPKNADLRLALEKRLEDSTTI